MPMIQRAWKKLGQIFVPEDPDWSPGRRRFFLMGSLALAAPLLRLPSVNRHGEVIGYEPWRTCVVCDDPHEMAESDEKRKTVLGWFMIELALPVDKPGVTHLRSRSIG